MISSSLTFERGVPADQANIYNDTLQPLVKLRRVETLLPYEEKVARQQQLSERGQASLQSLLDRANAAEQKIRAAINLDDAQASDLAADNIRWLFDHRVSLPDICQQFVRANDRSSFKALRALLPWAVTAGMLPGDGYPEQILTTARATVRDYEKALLTDAELSLLAEVQECDISMPLVRDNFTRLSDWLKAQARPGSLDGFSGGRIYKLYNWLGLPGSTVEPYIILSDDHAGKYSSIEANQYRSGVAPIEKLTNPQSVTSDYVAYYR